MNKTIIAHLISAFALVAPHLVYAGSATWKQSPFSDDWYWPDDNWTPRTIPNGPSDTATFDTSNQTAISVSSYQPEISGIVFNPGASAFTFTLTPSTVLNIVGPGITNNSRSIQNFIAYQDQYSSYGGEIDFSNSATAGNRTTFTLNGSR